MIYPKEVKTVTELLEKAGFEAYIVGGCLRNMLMGKEPNDWDMTTSAMPIETVSVLKDAGVKVIETGLKHGTVTALINSLPIEITTFRIDGEYTDSRHPDSVSFTRNIKDDLSRRDFTFNAMAYSESTGMIDLFGGEADLKSNLLRCVGDPQKRFEEDALRILRAFRFSSEHGFEIEKKTACAIREKAAGLLKISRERIYAELSRALLGENASGALRKLIDLGIMPLLFDGYKEAYAPNPKLFDELPKKKCLRFAAFFCGFPESVRDDAISSLKMSNEDKSCVKNLLSGVLRLKNSPFCDTVEGRRFIRTYGDTSEDIFALTKALETDVTDSEKAYRKALECDFPKSAAELAIGGSELLHLGAKGKEIGSIIAILMEETVKSPSINNKKELTELAKKYISEYYHNEHSDDQ